MAMMQNRTVRVAIFLLLIGNVGFAQSGSVQNAAGGGIGSYSGALGLFRTLGALIYRPPAPAVLAPGSLAIINYYSTGAAGQNATSSTVALLPVGAAAPIAAQVVATTDNTITFVVPPQSPAGPAQLIYKAQGSATQWVEIAIASASFALFQISAVGPAQAQLFAPDGSVTLNGLATPAKPGQTVVLWGSGLGSTAAANVGVTLGGVAQSVLFAGHSPSVPGVDQINFSVASGTPAGCYVPLSVSYGQNSVTSFLSVSADGSPCAHPLELSAGDLRALDGGGTVTIGQISLSSNLQAAAADHASRRESAVISFTDMNAALLASYFVSGAGGAAQGCSLPSVTGPGGISISILAPIGGSTGSFGNTMTLTGPGPTAISLTSPSYLNTLPLPADGPLNSVPAAVLAGGAWNWSSSGGQNLPASSFAFTLPPPILIAGSAPIELSHTEDQTLSWNGASYDASAVVTVTFSEAGSYTAPTLLTCVAPASAGSLTIPKSLLAQIGTTVATVSAQVSEPWTHAPHAQFKQNNGSSLSMVVIPASSDSRAVDIQ